VTVYGYARVSTDGQTLEGQIDQLRKAGAIKVYAEKQSGAKTDRAELKKVIKVLKPEDVLLVTKLDRLARSLKDILNVLDSISKNGVKFKVLNDPAMDTTNATGKFLMQVLGSVAELERSLILQRTSEGRRRALANGIKFGRKPKLNQYQIKEALERRNNGELMVDIARTYGVSRQTIARL
jgi:DNA invertase Pin-like site-specific DNA recombinase